MHGWLRDSRAAAPCHVRVLRDGDLLAEAVAREFRPDLLRTGHGHGHYGFRARLRRAVPPGRSGVVLNLPHADVSAPMGMEVPALEPQGLVPVEALLRTPEGWTVADLLASPGCLDMAASHAAMGTARFVDAAFRFALDRWPSPPEARLHAASLAAGRIGPQALLVELLTGRERADMDPGLPSPYDPEFPFTGLGGR